MIADWVLGRGELTKIASKLRAIWALNPADPLVHYSGAIFPLIFPILLHLGITRSLNYFVLGAKKEIKKYPPVVIDQ